MAKFYFLCPQCGHQVKAHDEWVGLEAQCPHCGHSITVEKPTEPASSAAVAKVPEADLPDEESAVDAEIKQHIQDALFAAKNGEYQEALKEFKFVLTKKSDDIGALYGVMMCEAYLSTPNDRLLDKVVFRYKKMEHLISSGRGGGWSCEELRQKFISQMGAFIVRKFKKIFSYFSRLSEDVKRRDAVNMLNVLSRGIVLSNPEALKVQEKAEALGPYLEQIDKVRKFIISLVDVDTAGETLDFKTLELVMRVFESTLDMDNEPPEIITRYDKICEAYEIKSIASAKKCSYQEAELEYERQYDESPFEENSDAVASKLASCWTVFKKCWFVIVFFILWVLDKSFIGALIATAVIWVFVMLIAVMVKAFIMMCKSLAGV